MFIFAPIRWAFRLISLLIVGILVYLVVSGVQVVLASQTSTATAAVGPARAIVVLGAPVIGSVPGASFRARLEQALNLYRARRAPTIVVAGARGNPAVDTVGLKWLTDRGVPMAYVTGVTVDNTGGEMAAAVALFSRGTHVIVVTNAIDALWAKELAGSAGFVAQISPAVGSKKLFLTEPGALWRQTSAVAVGRIVGYGRAEWAGP